MAKNRILTSRRGKSLVAWRRHFAYNMGMNNFYREEDFYIISRPDGQAEELAIFPQGAAYEERNFVWRLSVSVFEQEGAALDQLGEYDRVLLALDGDTVLIHQGQRVIRLKALEQDRFDGCFSTKSFGRILGYNLMVRKGAAGYLDVLEMAEDGQSLEWEDSEGRDYACYGFYFHQGHGVVNWGGQRQTVRSGEQLVIFCDGKEAFRADVMGQGVLIRSQIFYDEADLKKAAAGRQKGYGARLKGIFRKLFRANKKI